MAFTTPSTRPALMTVARCVQYLTPIAADNRADKKVCRSVESAAEYQPGHYGGDRRKDKCDIRPQEE